MSFLTLDRLVALFLVLCSLATILFWIPADSETGLVETVRRRAVIGDALAPTVAAVLCLVFSAGLALGATSQAKRPNIAAVFLACLFFVLCFAAVLWLMRFAGPLVVWSMDLAAAEALDYRQYRGSIPAKYIGIVAGGTLMIAGLSAYMDRELSWRRVGLAFLITLAIVLLYDLPFDSIVLPPNGDV